MNVSSILNQKGRAVATASCSDSIAAVAKVLAEKKIGALVIVSDDGRIAGIASERDVVRAVAMSGGAVLDKTVDTIMTTRVVTCTEQDTLEHLMQAMTRGRFRHLPVIDQNDKLAGIISIGDVVKLHVGEIRMEAEAMRQYISQH